MCRIKDKRSWRIGDRIMRLLTTWVLLTICLTAIGQTFQTKKERWVRVDSLFTNGKIQRTPLTHFSYVHVDTEIKYTDFTGNSVIIQNSLPKAGGDADEKCRYTDSAGKIYRYAIFWTRVINETTTPLELKIIFPATLPSPYSHIKIFLPSDTMTIDKESLYNYGITGLKTFLDTDFSNTTLERTINPKEENLFYIVLLSPLYHVGGTVRTRLVLKEQDLFYRISILPPFGSALIPCGQIVLKK
jgi:hypothetical protein